MHITLCVMNNSQRDVARMADKTHSRGEVEFSTGQLWRGKVQYLSSPIQTWSSYFMYCCGEDDRKQPWAGPVFERTMRSGAYGTSGTRRGEIRHCLVCKRRWVLFGVCKINKITSISEANQATLKQDGQAQENQHPATYFQKMSQGFLIVEESSYIHTASTTKLSLHATPKTYLWSPRDFCRFWVYPAFVESKGEK